MSEPRISESEGSVARGMTRRATAALGLLATLAIGSLALFWLQTRAIESGARILNVSGRQRMLSQRSALLAQGLVQAENRDERERLRTELRTVAATFERSHLGLVQGDPELGLPAGAPERVECIYYEGPDALDPRLREFLAALHALLDAPDPSLETESFEKVVDVASSGVLLALLDDVVTVFQAHEEAKIARLQQAKLIVFLLTLLAILLTRRWVILPMVARVRRYIRELRQQHESLARVTRLSTMGEMAAGIAHEINQPLTAITTYAQTSRRMILSGATGSVEHLEILDKIIGQARRSSEVIRRVRSLAEGRGSEREPTDLNGVIEDATQLAQTGPQLNGHRIESDLAGQLPAILADPVQILQVVLNILLNALEATEPGGGTVIIRSHPTGDGGVEITVSDRGVGLPEEIADQVFEPFFTTKGGMGMGLSISRSILDEHGGKLWFTANPEGGTTCHFTLPAMTSSTST